MGTQHPFPSLFSAEESLGPESSGEQGGRAERLPGAWREEGRGGEGGEIRLEGRLRRLLPSWFLQQLLPLFSPVRRERATGDGDSEVEQCVGQGAPASMDSGVRGPRWHQLTFPVRAFSHPKLAGLLLRRRGVGMEVERGHPPGSPQSCTL